MDRRLFLAAMGGGLATTVGTSGAAAGGRTAALISTYVSNVEQPRTGKALPGQGCRLALRVEPTRSYDPQSVLVSTTDGETVGYLPPIHGRLIAPLLSAGFPVDARVTSSKSTPRPAVRIQISLQPAGELLAV
jgi:hypothetical protein